MVLLCTSKGLLALLKFHLLLEMTRGRLLTLLLC